MTDRDAALDEPCPTCAAPPGCGCMNLDFFIFCGPHPARVAAAVAADDKKATP